MPSPPFWVSGLPGYDFAPARAKLPSGGVYGCAAACVVCGERRRNRPGNHHQREIYLDWKNICFVNGSLVTVSILSRLGNQLINIHGQHDSAALFDEANHLTFLDDFAGNGALRADYGEKYAAVDKLRREISRISMDEGEKLRRMETLKYQIEELKKRTWSWGKMKNGSRRKVLQKFRENRRRIE